MSLSIVPAIKNSGKVVTWSTLTHLPVYPQVRFWHKKRSLRQHRYRRWHKYAKEFKVTTAERGDRFGSLNNEDQRIWPSREKVFFVDGWINFGIFEQFFTYVHNKARVPGKRAIVRTQKMFLINLQSIIILSDKNIKKQTKDSCISEFN